MKDFTTEKYHIFCKKLVEKGYNIYPVREYLLNSMRSDTIILRHDVDSRPTLALRMAKIEYQMNIRSTYYFRHTKDVFDPMIIKEISNLGHEIGYHYEVLSKMKGNYEEAMSLFKYELDDFRRICEIDTICMHGNTLSKYDNRDIWKFYDFLEFHIIGEAYLSMGSISNYFSDTGRGWNSKYKLRDLMPSKGESSSSINTTDELLDFILNNNSNIVYILTHPEIWAETPYEWWRMQAMNKIFNTAKTVLRSMRDY